MGLGNIKMNPAGSVYLDYELGEALNVGDPVFVYDEAGIKIKKVFSKADDIVNGELQRSKIMEWISDDTFVAMCNHMNQMYCMIGTINPDDSVTWGAWSNPGNNYPAATSLCKVSDNKFMIFNRGAGYKSSTWICTVVGQTITWGAEDNFGAGNPSSSSCCYIEDDKVFLVYHEGVNSFCKIGNVSGTTVTWGTPISLTSTGPTYVKCAVVALNKIAITYKDSSLGWIECTTISGTDTIDGFGTKVECTNESPYTDTKIVQIATDKVALAWIDVSRKGRSCVGTFSGTTPIFASGDRITWEANLVYQTSGFDIRQTITNKFKILWYTSSVNFNEFEVAGTTISSAIPQTVYGPANGYVCLLVISETKSYLDWNYSPSRYIVMEGLVTTLADCIGLMQESGAIGETRNVDLIGGVSTKLSGLIIGAIYCIQNDGSLSVSGTDYEIGRAITAEKMLLGKSL